MVQKEEFDMDHMDAMKYSDLQKLAKKLGIKANMKADKLVKALKHFIELQGGSIKQDLSSAEETETETSGSDQEEAKTVKTKGRVRRGKQAKKNAKEEETTKKSDTNNDKVTQNERNIRKSEKVQTPNLPSATKKASTSVQRKSKTKTPITGVNATPGKRGSYTLKTPVIIAKGSAKAKVLSQGKKRKQTQSPGKEKSASKETTSVARRSATKKPGITPNSVSLTRKSVSIGPKISKSRTPASRNTTPITTTAIRSRVSVSVTSAPSSSKRLSAGMKRKRSKTPSNKKIENADTKKRKVETPNQDKVSKEIPEKDDKSLNEQVVSEKSEQVETTTRRQSARLSTSGVKDLVDSLTDNMSDAEMKASLMSALDKRVEECKSKGWNPEPTHIPRFGGLHKTQSLKQVTPGNKDWEQIHKKHFDKMDSLDIYLQKKRQRASSLNASVKKLKAMTEDMKSALTSLKKHKTPTRAERKNIAAKKSVRSTVSMFQSPASAVPFVPKVKSTKKMNLNFSSVSKTPLAPPVKAKIVSAARKITPRTAIKATSQVKSQKFATTDMVRSKSRVSGEKENVGKRSSAADKWKCDSVTRKSAVTPFTGRLDSKNESSIKKNVFNLHTSLSRPITWNMHKGTLRPFSGDRSFSRRTNVKEVKVQTREDRRTKASMHRADKRLEKQMKRRGIMA